MHHEIKHDRAEVLNFIRAYQDEHQFSPSVREVAAHLGFKSTSLAAYILDGMEKDGLLKRTPGIARSIVVLP